MCCPGIDSHTPWEREERKGWLVLRDLLLGATLLLWKEREKVVHARKEAYSDIGRKDRAMSLTEVLKGLH